MNCQHHWMIQQAEGPVSEGTCCHCGDTREFQNSISDPVKPVKKDGTEKQIRESNEVNDGRRRHALETLQPL